MENKYISLDGLQWYTSEIKEYISKQFLKNQTVHNYESYLNFPTIGDSACLYIDISANKIYRWDDDTLKYFTVGSDYNDIQIIDGNW